MVFYPKRLALLFGYLQVNIVVFLYCQCIILSKLTDASEWTGPLQSYSPYIIIGNHVLGVLEWGTVVFKLQTVDKVGLVPVESLCTLVPLFHDELVRNTQFV